MSKSDELMEDDEKYNEEENKIEDDSDDSSEEENIGDDDDDDDDDDTEEKEFDNKFSVLKNSIEENKFSYQNYVDIIELTRNHGDLTNLRIYREKMSELFPLTESK